MSMCLKVWNDHRFRFVFVCIVVGGIAALAEYYSRKTSHPHFWLGSGAFVASVVALFGDAVKSWIWRPILTLDYVHSPNYCDTPKCRWEVGGKVISANCYYFSIRVANRGTRSAQLVEVLATDLLKWNDQEMNWRHIRRYSMDLKWAWLGTPRLEVLPPKMDRFCNIGHIIDPQDRPDILQEKKSLTSAEENIAILSLDLEAQPNHGIHLLEPGKYQLSIIVVAANHKPIRRSLTIELNRTWHDKIESMLTDGIRMELT